MSALADVLAYAARGWQCFPLKPQSKEPACQPRILRRDDEPGDAAALVCELSLQCRNSHRHAEQRFCPRHRW